MKIYNVSVTVSLTENDIANKMLNDISLDESTAIKMCACESICNDNAIIVTDINDAD